MRRIPVCSILAALAGFLMTSSAQAQSPAPEVGAPPSSTATASFTGASSTRGRGIGVGAGTMLNGTSGLMGTWGAGAFHVDGLFGLHRYAAGGNATTSFTLGGRFWYHIHAASFADFSVGGGVGLVRWVSAPGTPQSDTHWDVSMEIGGQIRAFIVPNVALLADLGLGITFTSNDDILLGGQSMSGSSAPGGAPNFVTGTLGIAYFFE
jgi:hypothetical protein